METIGTLINNLKTKYTENAGDAVLLNIANAIVLELEHKLGKAKHENDVLIPTLAYQGATSVPAEKKLEAKTETTTGQDEEKSLNDVLKEERTEISQVLENAPVQDLRKAIGINDRFVFINELFFGNENLYDQSIKTLNRIDNLEEAESWIAQELKLKLNWDNETTAVQQFYKLVRRKYS